MIEIADFSGAAASVLTTFSLLPQTVKVVRTKNTTDLSLLTYISLTAGLSMWLVYGIMIDRWPLILANSICVPLAAIILFMKIRHK